MKRHFEILVIYKLFQQHMLIRILIIIIILLLIILPLLLLLFLVLGIIIHCPPLHIL